MTKRTHMPIVLALLIAAVLASASLIVAKNNAVMSGSGGDRGSGFLH